MQPCHFYTASCSRYLQVAPLFNVPGSGSAIPRHLEPPSVVHRASASIVGVMHDVSIKRAQPAPQCNAGVCS